MALFGGSCTQISTQSVPMTANWHDSSWLAAGATPSMAQHGQKVCSPLCGHQLAVRPNTRTPRSMQCSLAGPIGSAALPRALRCSAPTRSLPHTRRQLQTPRSLFSKLFGGGTDQA